MQAFEKAGLHCEVRRLSECDHPTIARLFLATEGKYVPGREMEEVIGMLGGIQEEIDHDTRVALGLRGEQVIAFALNFKHPAEYESRFVGMDYDALDGKECAYFNVMYYATVQAALIEGVDAIVFGLSASEAKLRRGCSFRESSFLLVPPDGFPSEALQRFLCEKSLATLEGAIDLAKRVGSEGAARELELPLAHYRERSR
jgi:predicted N-acyltransferase